MKFKLIVLILVVAAVFWYCTKPKTPTPQQTIRRTTTGNTTPTNNTSGGSTGGGTTGGGSTGGTNGLTEPVNWYLGVSNMMNYGSDYFTFINSLSGGEARFWFYGKSNGNAYPSGKNGNGYETVSFASHSVNMHNNTGYSGGNRTDVRSKCKYTIKDSAGNIVLYVEDTKGGGATYGRNNNHPDNCNRYLPTGAYTLEYQNTSDESGTIPQTVVFFRQGENNFFEYQINEIVDKGVTITRTINVYDTGSEQNTFFKFNCNFLPL